MRVLLFAGLAEDLGCRELLWPDDELPPTAGQLEAALRDREPRLRDRRFRMAVNRAYAAAGDPLSAADEVALIPPVSGG